MPEYRMAFFGRRLGAIGMFYPVVVDITAPSPVKAVLELYSKYEHCQGLTITDLNTGTVIKVPDNLKDE